MNVWRTLASMVESVRTPLAPISVIVHQTGWALAAR